MKEEGGLGSAHSRPSLPGWNLARVRRPLTLVVRSSQGQNMTVRRALAIRHPDASASRVLPEQRHRPSITVTNSFVLFIYLFSTADSTEGPHATFVSELLSMDWEFYSSTLSLSPHPPPGASVYLFLPLEINFLFGCFYDRVTQRFISVSGGTALLFPTAAEKNFLIKEP